MKIIYDNVILKQFSTSFCFLQRNINNSILPKFGNPKKPYKRGQNDHYSNQGINDTIKKKQPKPKPRTQGYRQINIKCHMPSLARQGRKIYSLANSNYHYWWTAVRKLRVGFNTFAVTNHHRRQSFFGIFRPQAVSFLFIVSILCRHSSFTLLNRCHIALYFFISSHVLSAIFLSDVIS